MISLKDKYALYKLRRRLHKLRKQYQVDIEKARKDGKDRKDIEMIIGEMHAVCEEYEFEIEEIITRDLKSKAEKYYIALPDRLDLDSWENHFGTSFLTDGAKATLRKQIKAQRRDDYEFLIKVLTLIITMFTGLIGALIGLLSVINK